MSMWKIAWRSIQQRALASSLTGLSMALGVMLVVAVLVVHGVIDRSFLNNSGLGYNIVVGAKGGRLDLVLNTVYYLARPVENIPFSYYQEFVDGKFKPYVDKAIPICLGDMFQDFRVIGTTPAFFNDLDYGGHKYEFAAGRNFEPDEYYGAVIGSTVAREAGLKVGSEFQPSHGAGPDAHKHDPFTVLGVLKPTGTPNDRGLFINMEGFYLIPEHAKPVDDDEAPPAESKHEQHQQQATGGAAPHDHDESHAAAEGAPSNAAADQQPTGDATHDSAEKAHVDQHEEVDGNGRKAAAEPADAHPDHADDDHPGAETHEHSHEHAHDHGHEHGHDHHHEPLPISQREVTAILVLTASIGGAPPELYAPELIKRINKDSVAQAVLPIREMSTLFGTFVDPLRLLLLGLTVTIVVVSGIGILVSIYNSMSERRHEIAVIRALGAGRRTVMLIVLLESILLSLIGGLAGWVVGHGLIGLLSPWIAFETGVSIGWTQFVGYELVIIPGLIALASLVGYLPAMAAYRTDVAKALSANP
ncbi:MAG TPA: ABC transporter permease [Pirellulales bacterium]|nr:ABC transporter permease [Pirellulales bacterium]